MKKINKSYHAIKKIAILSTALLATVTGHAASDPYASVATVTNTIAWPYNMTTFGNDSFQMGSVESGNTDSILLDLIKKNNGLSFPKDFGFGIAHAAYQYEGNRVAPSEENPNGIGWSMWDVFSEKASWLNVDGTNISEVAPTSQFTYPSGKNAIQGFYPEYYNQDIQLAKELGVKYFRMSISWPRLFPQAGMTEPDPEGIAYYKNVLQTLKDQGFTVLLTLYHWDLPAWLYNYGDANVPEDKKTYGWLDTQDAKNNLALIEFQKYADTVYKNFGEYTPYFASFNEPLTFSNNGLYIGNHAPGKDGFELLRQKNPAVYGVDAADSDARLNYLQSANLIKAHYLAYKTFDNYRKTLSEKHDTPAMFGIVLNSDWAEPYRVNQDANGKLSYHPDDIAASKRNMDFMLGWWLDPVMYGDWPKSMKDNVGNRLPNLQTDTSCLAASGAPVTCDGPQESLATYIAQGGALDYLNINHYTGYFAADIDYAKQHFSDSVKENSVPTDQYNGTPFTIPSGWSTDQQNFITHFRYQKYGDHGSFANEDQSRAFVIGMAGAQSWLRHTYFAYTKLLQYIDYYYLDKPGYTKQKVPFSSLGIYLTENGTSLRGESQKTGADQLSDPDRKLYIQGNLAAIWEAIQDDVNVKLYTYWSIADNFEWAEGYDSRFGIIWIDYENNYQRKPKDSFYYFKDVIKNNSVMP